MFDTETTVRPAGDEAVKRLDELAAANNRALLDVLDHVGTVETEDLWFRYGTSTVVELLCSRYGVSRRTARDWLRVSETLEELPRIRAVFACGRLSWEQLREVTRIARADTDADWAVWAQEMTSSDIRSARRPPTTESVEEAHRQRSLDWWFEADIPVFHLEMTCPDAEGAMIATALTRLASQAEPDPDTGVYEPFDARCADALWQMASQALAADSDVDRATVLVTTSLEAIRTHSGGRILDGPAIVSDTLERLLCDTRLQLAVEGKSGSVAGVGRAMRTPPPRLRRIVVTRDNGCRFPRCRRNRWIHIHHLVHWAHGGPTDLDNLITLCGLHHRLIHEGGWTVSGDPNGVVTWIDRFGNVHDPGPLTADDLMRRRLSDSWVAVAPPNRPTGHGFSPP